MAEPQEYQPLLGAKASLEAPSSQDFVLSHQYDQSDPQTWSKKYRWFLVALLCSFTATVSYTTVAIVPIADDIVKELGGRPNRTVSVLFVTIWELGEAAGPLFIGPLSELYGRCRVYNVANCLFIVGAATTALSQGVGLLVFSRFATGCAVATNILNPVIVGDLFPSESRGVPVTVAFLANFLGSACGPTISGALSEVMGWRAVMWTCVAIAGVSETLFIIFFRETYRPVLLERLANQNRAEAAGVLHMSKTGDKQRNQSLMEKLRSSMTRPARIIWSSSLLQCLCLYAGVAFSSLYIYVTSASDILAVRYSFSPSQRGSSYLAYTLGTILSTLVCNASIDKIYNKLGKRHGGYYPEGRLPLSILGGMMLPITVTLYGWLAQTHIRVAFFLADVTVLSMSFVFAFMPATIYVTDAFGPYSASATSTMLISRNLLSSFLPLVVPPLTRRIGYGWGFTVMAAFFLVLTPIPCLVMRYGPTWRQRSKYTRG